MPRNEPMDAEAWPEVEYLAKQIKKAREEAGLSQRELAETIRVTQSYLAAMEARRVNPMFTTLIILAQRLDRPLSYFIFDRPRPT